jgi:hypothetical protein
VYDTRRGESRHTGDHMSELYGHVWHPTTGKYMARVKDGRMTMFDGKIYKLIGDMIIDDDGAELGYLSTFVVLSEGSSDVANRLIRR